MGFKGLISRVRSWFGAISVGRASSSGVQTPPRRDASNMEGSERQSIRDEIERLENVNRRLRQFSQMVAHDLTGPITGQRRSLQFLREDLDELDVDLSPDVLSNIADMDEMLSRQHRLVVDLLEWAWGRQVNAPASFDPNERMQGIIKMVNLPPGFQLTFPDNMPWLFANPVAWDLVMRNLISNAVKHHDKTAGHIQVSYELGHTQCMICVTDDGPGIPDQYIERIFEPFQTLTSSKGGGLGLAFVKEVVEGWGGRVFATNVRSGRGVRIRFSIPLSAERGVSKDLRALKSG